MNKAGHWNLSPAFDVTYSDNPDGEWAGRHQLLMNGKRGGFAIEDFKVKVCAKNVSMQYGMADEIVDQVLQSVMHWRHFADEAGVPEDVAEAISRTHRLQFSA
jgi:serine/threonine-protein kinase HipA